MENPKNKSCFLIISDLLESIQIQYMKQRKKFWAKLYKIRIVEMKSTIRILYNFADCSPILFF